VGGLLSAFLAECVLITWRDVHAQKVLPVPADFVAAAGIYGVLGFIPESGQKFAGAVGWTLVLATFLNLWNPQNPTSITGKANTGTATEGTGPVGTGPATTATGAQVAV